MTLRYLYGRDDLVAPFVARMIPHVRELGFGKCKTIGVLDENSELIAGFVYHNFSPQFGVMEISSAAVPGVNWLTRATLAVMYGYPFEQCRAQMLAHTVREDNTRLLRQLSAIGCMFVTIPRLYGRNENGVICLLTDDAWASNKVLKRCRQNRINLLEKAA
jgi:hypothetical protein